MLSRHAPLAFSLRTAPLRSATSPSPSGHGPPHPSPNSPFRPHPRLQIRPAPRAARLTGRDAPRSAGVELSHPPDIPVSGIAPDPQRRRRAVRAGTVPDLPLTAVRHQHAALLRSDGENMPVGAARNIRPAAEPRAHDRWRIGATKDRSRPLSKVRGAAIAGRVGRSVVAEASQRRRPEVDHDAGLANVARAGPGGSPGSRPTRATRTAPPRGGASRRTAARSGAGPRPAARVAGGRAAPPGRRR